MSPTSRRQLTAQFGAIRYDRDIRGVINFLSAQSAFGGAREKFARLQQFATVLNLDPVSTKLVPSLTDLQDEHVDDFFANSGIPWRISKAEYKSILTQRQ